MNFENKGSGVVNAWGRYQHPTRLSRGTVAFDRVCKTLLQNCVFSLFMLSFPFIMFFKFFSFLCFYFFGIFMFFFSFYGADKGVFLAPTYSSIAMRKLDLRSSLRSERWLICFFFIFSERLILIVNKIRLRRWTFESIF